MVVIGQQQADGEATQFGGESRIRFGGGALRPGGMSGGGSPH